MGSRNPQSAAKRARELALRERRERKRVKKAEAAAERAAAKEPPGEITDNGLPPAPGAADQSGAE